MKKLILLDLDNTLFNAQSFREFIFPKISEMLGREDDKIIIGLCQKIYDEQMAAYGLFDPVQFLDALFRITGEESKKKELIDMIFDGKLLGSHMHRDVSRTLNTLSALGEVGILSQGERRIQKAKLVTIQHLLHSQRIHIPKNKKKNMRRVLEKYSDYKLYFVDDRLHMLYQAKHINPEITVIWIKRGRYAKAQKNIPGFSPDAIVNNLDEIVAIVRNT